MKIRAPAKVNLTLEVLRRRDDGYHEIKSILQTIDLCDELELEQSNSLEFSCDKAELNNEENLVVRASRLLQRKAGITGGARVRLKKLIPVSAGLGGGSSDAAALLRGLNKLWGLKLSANKLMEVSSELGSDVPFFIQGGAALAEGRGEIVTPLPFPGEYWVVLFMPPLDAYSDKTSQMYGGLTGLDYTQGHFTESLSRTIKSGGEIEQSLLYNVFDRVAPKLYPRLPFFQELLAKAAGMDKAHLSGSGPCLYVISKDEARAKNAWRSLVGKKYTAYLCKIVAGAESGL